MKIKRIANILILITLFEGCSKNNSPVVTPENTTYLSTSTNSSWNYEETDSSINTPVVSNYTITSTARDTSANGRTYHIFSNSDGGFRYESISGHDYYQLDSLPAGLGTGVFERLYLKDDAAAGTSWSQNLSVTVPGVPLPVPVTITNTIAERNITRVVKGVTYNNVIHTSTSISSAFIPAAALTTAIDSYYAPKYGLIENSNNVQLDYLGLVVNVNLHTRLASADIK